MFYEEDLINGVLMFRTTPDGEWRQCDIEKMSKRLVYAESKVDEMVTELLRDLRECREKAYMEGKQYEKDRMKELLGV